MLGRKYKINGKVRTITHVFEDGGVILSLENAKDLRSIKSISKEAFDEKIRIGKYVELKDKR